MHEKNIKVTQFGEDKFIFEIEEKITDMSLLIYNNEFDIILNKPIPKRKVKLK
jgi:hypothetical protein